MLENQLCRMHVSRLASFVRSRVTELDRKKDQKNPTAFFIQTNPRVRRASRTRRQAHRHEYQEEVSTDVHQRVRHELHRE